MSYPPQQPDPYDRGPVPPGHSPLLGHNPSPGQYPPGHNPPGHNPPGQYPPGQFPPGAQPAGQYSPADYPVPAGYQLVRPGRPALLVAAVLLGILAVAALGIALALGHAATACGSDIGQIAQAFDQQAAGDCSTASTARTALEIAAPILAIGCIAAVIGYRRR